MQLLYIEYTGEKNIFRQMQAVTGMVQQRQCTAYVMGTYLCSITTTDMNYF